MERTIIIGCGGAGKSTLARQLGEKLNIPVIHLDKLWWRPGWQSVTQEEFSNALQVELAKDKWIMDGNFNYTLPERIARCDTIIYMDFTRIACLMGVFKRILTTYGQVRPDMGEGCPERFDWDFLKWVWTFNRKKREPIYRFIKEAKHAETIVLKNRRAVRDFLNGI